jgi:hypothetical protein
MRMASLFGRRLRPRCGRIASLCLTLFTAIALLHAAPDRPTEYQVKAAYLFNFGRFVTWPAAAEGEFHICVLGRDPFGNVLDNTVRGEKIEGHDLVVRRIAAVSDATGCRILFISASEDRRMAAHLAGLRDAPILTVSDSPRFSQREGMIEFVKEGERVRFEVNLIAAERAKLTLSSDLLKVATHVRRAGGND